MKAVVLSEGKIAVEDIPQPPLAPDEVMVHVRACGICGSDLRYLAGENPWAQHTLGISKPNPPRMVLGHEVAGEIVAVIGCGSIGLLIIQIAKALGAGPVIGVDVAQQSPAMARQLGADVTANALESDPVEAVRAATGGVGAAASFDTVGSDQTIIEALRALRRGARTFFLAIEGVTTKPRMAFVESWHHPVPASLPLDSMLTATSTLAPTKMWPSKAEKGARISISDPRKAIAGMPSRNSSISWYGQGPSLPSPGPQ